MKTTNAIIACLILLCLSTTAWAQSVSKEQLKGLDEQVQDIKQEVLSISAELSNLEEKLLYPSNTQVSVFISVLAGSKYSPDAVQIKMDGKDVAHHIYSFNEVEALAKGGVQRVYTGNLRTGEHNIDISVIGKKKGASNLTEKASFTISKGVGPKLVEIVLGSKISIKEK